MFIYKILAVLLMAPTITISTDALYFPYSFLGLTLFLLTSVFTRKNFFPALDLMFWFFGAVFVITHQALSYRFLIYIFVIYQYINLYIISHQRFLIMGIILSFAAIMLPAVNSANMILLAGFMGWFHYANKGKRKFKSEPIEQYLHELIIPDDDEDTLIEDMRNRDSVIPCEQQQKETDYVIPSNEDN